MAGASGAGEKIQVDYWSAWWGNVQHAVCSFEHRRGHGKHVSKMLQAGIIEIVGNPEAQRHADPRGLGSVVWTLSAGVWPGYQSGSPKEREL